MGLVLGSSVVIAAERRGDTVVAMLKQIASSLLGGLLRRNQVEHAQNYPNQDQKPFNSG
jgi:hypothetical protein